MSSGSGTGLAARLIVLAGIAALTIVAVLLPPDLHRNTPVPRITGEIQHFILKQNPTAVPDVRFLGAGGKEMSLRDFRGRVVVLNFWATWCAPCVHEMPSLDRMAAHFDGRPVAIVALNEDRDGAGVAKPFLDKLGLKRLALYTDPKGGAVQRDFLVSSLPTTIVIDARGREVGRLVGPADWSSPDAVALVETFVRQAR